jgi:Rad3-related DNA helicase|tara:strand:- start:8174 stop:9790 length:1617 start_codon:yes stop_codon:yes gene_type:complete
MFKYTELFPHKEIRDSQASAIEFALKSFINDGKKIVIIEAGTGVGKSAVGLTVARYLNKHKPPAENFSPGAYFVTTQKILQDQYVKDFGAPDGRMISIKSSSNYQCGYHKKNTCQESQRLLRNTDKDERFFKACTYNCIYKNEKQKFLDSPASVTNFPYFLTEAAFAKKIIPRNFLVIDESHNIESELSNFIEIRISERFAKQALKLRWPARTTQFQVVKWIEDVYFPKAKSQLNHMERTLNKTGLKERIKDFEALSKQYDMIKSHVGKIETFLQVYDKDNWVMENVSAYGRSMRKFTFKAIDISPFVREYLFRLGDHILMMSATILDRKTFCNSLGLVENEVAFISIPSPFSVENRPVISYPIGSMNAKNIDASLPKMAQAVREILKQHKNDKGIIHCHTYKIAKYLKSHIRSKRLLIHNTENRDETLRRHEKSKEPTVILSPSMSEGVDLKDDLSRFQIIMKIPYPYLGDPLIRKRMNKWKRWYNLQTAKKIVQSAGRSVRSSDDRAVTYILDADWERFFRQNRDMFPHEFKRSLL